MSAAIPENILNTLCEAIKEGVDLESACYLVDLSPNILHSTMEKGKIEQFHRQSGRVPRVRQDDAVKVWTRIMKARAEAVRFHQKVLRNAGLEGEWKASQFWLQRNHPGVYSNQNLGALSGDPESLPEIGA